jgi:hypothetical protein
METGTWLAATTSSHTYKTWKKWHRVTRTKGLGRLKALERKNKSIHNFQMVELWLHQILSPALDLLQARVNSKVLRKIILPIIRPLTLPKINRVLAWWVSIRTNSNKSWRRVVQKPRNLLPFKTRYLGLISTQRRQQPLIIVLAIFHNTWSWMMETLLNNHRCFFSKIEAESLQILAITLLRIGGT